MLVRSGLSYNPFCKVSEYNHCRLFIKLTNKCNLFCKHCMDGSNPSIFTHFSFKKIKKIIRTTIIAGITKIDFTGGEVFFVDYFMELLEYIDKLPVSYSIFTNLTLLTDDLILKLSNLKGLNCIYTSMEYFEPSKQDEFCGRKGSFEKICENIMKLKNKDINVIINSVVLNDNHNDILKIKDFCLKR